MKILSKTNELFIDYLLELLAPLKHVRARKMFGGYGIFKQDLMFALVADEVLYLKVDQETTQDYKALGLGPFVYEKKERRCRCSIIKLQKMPWIHSLIFVNGQRRPIVQPFELSNKNLPPVHHESLVLHERSKPNPAIRQILYTFSQ